MNLCPFVAIALCAWRVPRFLFVHAHPDDETLTTGATIAHYAARGARVRVVTCTLGEEGEVIGERWARLAVDHADQLGGYRIGELSAALTRIGGRRADLPRRRRPLARLGHGGHAARGTGSDSSTPNPRDAVGALVAIIRDLRPHVVVSYDPNGGYGHPDHIHAHEVTTAAVAAAGGSDYPGEPWSVPKFYWTVMARSAMAAGLDDSRRRALPQTGSGCPRRIPVRIRRRPDRRRRRRTRESGRQGRRPAGTRDPGQRRARRPGAARCPTSWRYPIGATEHYVLAAGAAGERDDRGWETDLLAGLNLG